MAGYLGLASSFLRQVLRPAVIGWMVEGGQTYDALAITDHRKHELFHPCSSIDLGTRHRSGRGGGMHGRGESMHVVSGRFAFLVWLVWFSFAFLTSEDLV